MNKNITKSDVFNMRVRVKRLLPVLERIPSFESFPKGVNASSVLSDLDQNDITDDEVYSLAQEILQDIIDVSGDNRQRCLV